MAKILESKVYEYREIGKNFCTTAGSDHYRCGDIEPIDLMVGQGCYLDFMIGNIIKYATRYRIGKNLEDLKKISDYAQLLAGIDIFKQHMNEQTIEKTCSDDTHIATYSNATPSDKTAYTVNCSDNSKSIRR
jgi:hypothetical protein